MTPVAMIYDDDAFVYTDDEVCISDDDADAVDADLTQPVVAAAFSVVECDGFPIIT